MKVIYNTLEELMSSCGNSELKSNVSAVLRNDCIPWSFVSASADGDICQSEFSSPIDGTEQEHHLSCKIGPRNERWHFSTCNLGTIPALPYMGF